jgi:excisionase family DNA binding protein
VAARYNTDLTMSAKMLTVSEVAKLLHVHPNTVRNWSDNGLLKAYRLGYRNDRRFNLEDINRMLADNLNIFPK